ncbi:sensor histidine kinase [Sphaerisporangium melleum]|uniref:sensor histidine kinase n=1 Tax=Sphaerisporangium melleum TaxID=321316 RepID=UPI00166817A6|nr:histidine kinase [Sphaerisporangium melleum]
MSRLTALYRPLPAWRWFAFDIALATGLLITTLEQSGDREASWWVLTAPMLIGLAVQRRRPPVAVVLACAGALGHHLQVAMAVEPLDLAVPITLYTLAASDRPRRVAAVTLGVMLACVGLLSVLRPVLPTDDDRPAAVLPVRPEVMDRPHVPGSYLPLFDGPMVVGEPDEQGGFERLMVALRQGATVMLVLGLTYAVGDNVRSRRAHLRTLEARAADLEREQRQRVALATAAERARITRELHDVVAHGLSVMVVQAQGGAAALRRHPERTEAALQNVISTGRSSLAEMRRLLTVVRADPAADPELAPQPGVGALPDLVDRIRAAGTTVTFVVDGDPVPLPAGVDLSAYRIAQEALTNTLKHAGGDARAAVRLAFREDALEIEVTDDGAGAAAWPAGDGGGSGLHGIAERVSLLGGELTAGPREPGGFRVRAVLPLRAAARNGGVA